MTFRTEIIGDQTLILGDCREVMPTLGRFDACVTDPPYGICADENPVRGKHIRECKGWDKERPPDEVFQSLMTLSENLIIWGGNYFADLLPPSMRWLVWDKMQGEFSLSDCEFAWTNQQAAARIFRMARGTALKDGKYHETQKPVALISWCLSFVPAAKTIFDPYMGSGTTLVACQRLGLNGTGIERDAYYFDIACRRIEQAVAQPRLFAEPVQQPKQEVML